MNSIVMRDGLRNEVAKQQRIEEEMHEKREQQKMDIAKLNTMINQSEEQMTKLRNRYEKAITHRNERYRKISAITDSMSKLRLLISKYFAPFSLGGGVFIKGRICYFRSMFNWL